MSRWFRHYAGMMRDEKLVRVAIASKQTVERVMWVWGAILESAAEINDGGRYDFDSGEAAYFLRCDSGDVDAVLVALESLGRVGAGVICMWSDRQYDSDSSRERQKRYRDRNKQSRGDDSDVTPPSRDDDVTPQETETDTEEKEEAKASSKKRGTRLPDDFKPDMVVARSLGLSEARAQIEADKFRDYWIAQPGQRGVKLDWLATWRNWCRNAPKPRAASPPPGKRMNAVEALMSNRTDNQHEPTSRRSHHDDVELLPADEPGLPALAPHLRAVAGRGFG